MSLSSDAFMDGENGNRSGNLEMSSASNAAGSEPVEKAISVDPIFFNTHLSDLRLLNDPSTTRERRNSIRILMASDVDQISDERSEIVSLAEKIFSAWDIVKGMVSSQPKKS